MSDAQPHRFPIVVVGVALEGGLAALAWGIGALSGRSPARSLRWDWRNAALGVAAIGPMLLLFAWSLRSKLRAFVRIRPFFDEVVRPLFAPCTILDLALVSIAAGVGEELLFRGVIQAEAVRWLGLGAGIALASLLFGLLHPITPAYVMLAACMGAYLGLVWVATDNLLAPIIAHALYDFLALVYVLRGPGTSAPRAHPGPGPRPDPGPGRP